MKIIIRCDSSYSIGSGHLIRCLNLALLLEEKDVTFICRNLSGNINARVIQNQFKLIELPEIPGYTNGTHIDETNEIIQILKLAPPDLIIVDHYGLDEEWEKAVRTHCTKLFAIDDLNRRHTADIILDQNFKLDIPDNYKKSNSVLLLGPKYCILNRSFYTKPLEPRIIENMRNLLVFFGGSDPQSMTLKILNIASDHFLSLNWVFVIGSQNQDVEEIKELTAQHNNFSLYINTPNMASLMEKADVFIGAGGTTTWERAKLGLPSIVISIAKNQVETSQLLNQCKIIDYLGTSEEVSEMEIINSIRNFSEDKLYREELSKNSKALQVGEKISDLLDLLR